MVKEKGPFWGGPGFLNIVKIGISSNPERRRKEVEEDDKVEIEEVVECEKVDLWEGALHDTLDHRRKNREYFYITDQELERLTQKEWWPTFWALETLPLIYFMDDPHEEFPSDLREFVDSIAGEDNFQRRFFEYCRDHGMQLVEDLERNEVQERAVRRDIDREFPHMSDVEIENSTKTIEDLTVEDIVQYVKQAREENKSEKAGSRTVARKVWKEVLGRNFDSHVKQTDEYKEFRKDKVGEVLRKHPYCKRSLRGKARGTNYKWLNKDELIKYLVSPPTGSDLNAPADLLESVKEELVDYMDSSNYSLEINTREGVRDKYRVDAQTRFTVHAEANSYQFILCTETELTEITEEEFEELNLPRECRIPDEWPVKRKVCRQGFKSLKQETTVRFLDKEGAVEKEILNEGSEMEIHTPCKFNLNQCENVGDILETYIETKEREADRDYKEGTAFQVME